jgi:tetratricopeptide (TPR) repeat protein
MRLVRVLVVAALLLVPGLARAQTAATEILVMPFDNSLTDPKLFWLGEGSAVLLSETLERYGAMTVTRESRLSAFERLQLPPAAALSHATVIKVGQFVGASDVIVGAYALTGDRLTVRARAIRLEAGRLLPEVVEEGPLSELLELYDRTARRLRNATSPAPPPRNGTLLTSPSALELFVKGLIAEQLPTKRSLLEQASKAAPDEDRIKIALWHVHTDLGEHVRALEVVRRVPTTSIRSRPARYMSARSMIDLKRYDEAFATLKTLHAEARSAEALNAMGVIQLRRGGNPQTGTAAQFFSQASQTDPSDPDYFFNLGYAHWIDKDPPAAIYWLREAVRRAPTDGDAHFVLSAALQQGGAAAEAARERELALRLSSSYGEPRNANEPVPRGLERLKEYLERQSPNVDSIITSAGQRDQAELATFHLEAGRRAFEREADREAERELRRALYLSPYLAEANLLLGRLHLRAGRPADAIQAFKIALWSEDTAAGHVALAEAYLQGQNTEGAKEEIDRALALDPNSTAARALRDKLPK